MLETSNHLVTSAALSKVGPDYFAFYTCEVKELLAEKEDFMPFVSELIGNKCNTVGGQFETEPSFSYFFSNSVGDRLSNQKSKRLNALLRQAVASLTPEVDETLDPVLSMRRLQSQVRSKKLISNEIDAMDNGEIGQTCSNKRIKMSSSSNVIPIEGLACKCMDSKCSHVAPCGKELSNDLQKRCAHCNTKTFNPEGKFQCNACGTAGRTKGKSHLASNKSVDVDGEGDGDLQFLLENDISLVEETMKKYSGQLLITLDHMEKQLEELLNSVMSACRPMSRTEKQHLQKLIQKLPPKNLNRVVEIIQHSTITETQCSDEIFVDLEREDNVTLWRLYYYAGAVENARKLAAS